MRVLAEEGTNQMIKEIKKLKDTTQNTTANLSLYHREYEFWHNIYDKVGEMMFGDRKPQDSYYINIESSRADVIHENNSQADLDACTAIVNMGIYLGLYTQNDFYNISDDGFGASVPTLWQTFQISEKILDILNSVMTSTKETVVPMGFKSNASRVSDLPWLINFIQSIQPQQ